MTMKNDDLYGCFATVTWIAFVMSLPVFVVAAMFHFGPEIGGVLGYMAGAFIGFVFWLGVALFVLIGSC